MGEEEPKYEFQYDIPKNQNTPIINFTQYKSQAAVTTVDVSSNLVPKVIDPYRGIASEKSYYYNLEKTKSVKNFEITQKFDYINSKSKSSADETSLRGAEKKVQTEVSERDLKNLEDKMDLKINVAINSLEGKFDTFQASLNGKLDLFESKQSHKFEMVEAKIDNLHSSLDVKLRTHSLEIQNFFLEQERLKREKEDADKQELKRLIITGIAIPFAIAAFQYFTK